MTKPRKKTKRSTTFSTQDWRDIYDALMDAANGYHSGPRADRTIDLARRIREEKLP